MGEGMGISPPQSGCHCHSQDRASNIYGKLGIRSRNQAIVRTRELNLL